MYILGCYYLLWSTYILFVYTTTVTYRIIIEILLHFITRMQPKILFEQKLNVLIDVTIITALQKRTQDTFHLGSEVMWRSF